MGTQGPVYRIPQNQTHQQPAKPKFWENKRTKDLLTVLIIIVLVVLAKIYGIGKDDPNCPSLPVQDWVDATNRITTQSKYVDEIFVMPSEYTQWILPTFDEDDEKIAGHYEAAYHSQFELAPPPCLSQIHQYILDIYLYHWGYYHSDTQEEIDTNEQLALEAIDNYNRERLRLIEEGILDK